MWTFKINLFAVNRSILLACLLFGFINTQKLHHLLATSEATELEHIEFLNNTCRPNVFRGGTVRFFHQLELDHACFQIAPHNIYLPTHFCHLPTHCGKVSYTMVKDVSFFGFGGQVLCHGDNGLFVFNETLRLYHLDFSHSVCDTFRVTHKWHRNDPLIRLVSKTTAGVEEFAWISSKCLHLKEDVILNKLSFKMAESDIAKLIITVDTNLPSQDICPNLVFTTLEVAIQSMPVIHKVPFDTPLKNDPKYVHDCVLVNDDYWVLDQFLLYYHVPDVWPLKSLDYFRCFNIPSRPSFNKRYEFMAEVFYQPFFSLFEIFAINIFEKLFFFWISLISKLLTLILSFVPEVLIDSVFKTIITFLFLYSYTTKLLASLLYSLTLIIISFIFQLILKNILIF